MAEIFISYPRVARTKVEPIKQRLDALGFDLYFDLHNIDGGEDFPAEIDREVKNAKVVLAFWTPAAFSRRWCMQECRIGLMRQVLLPIKLEPFDDLEIPVEFGGVNYFDLTDFDENDEHEDWRRLIESLRRRVHRVASTAQETQWRSFASKAAHDLRWELIQDSLDWREYQDFYEEFPRAPQRAEARLRQRLLQDWGTTARRDLSAITAFRRKVNDLRLRQVLGAFPALDQATSGAFESEISRPMSAQNDAQRPIRARSEYRASRMSWPLAAGVSGVMVAVIGTLTLISTPQNAHRIDIGQSGQSVTCPNEEVKTSADGRVILRSCRYDTLAMNSYQVQMSQFRGLSLALTGTWRKTSGECAAERMRFTADGRNSAMDTWDGSQWLRQAAGATRIYSGEEFTALTGRPAHDQPLLIRIEGEAASDLAFDAAFDTLHIWRLSEQLPAQVICQYERETS